MLKRFLCYGLVFLAMGFFLASCQKDESVQDLKATAVNEADTAQKIAELSPANNFLVSKGTLVIKLPDTSYTFDAALDSIAFVNLSNNGKAYFGITAINKAHTVSFGISSAGGPIAGEQGIVSGCQLLLHPSEASNFAYTLIRNVATNDFGLLLIEKYKQDTVLAKGTFHTYLANVPQNSPMSLVNGSFELKLK